MRSMGKIIRDFSQETVEDIRQTILEGMLEHGNAPLLDWWDDIWKTLTDEIEISDYLDNVEAYHKEVIDRHNTTLERFDKILEKAHNVDIIYAGRQRAILHRMQAFYNRIVQTAALLAPQALEMSNEEYQELIDRIQTAYQGTVAEIEKEKAVFEEAALKLEEPSMLVYAKSVVLGAGMSVVRDVLEEIFVIMTLWKAAVLNLGNMGQIISQYETEIGNIRKVLNGEEIALIQEQGLDEQTYYFIRMLGDIGVTMASLKGLEVGVSAASKAIVSFGAAGAIGGAVGGSPAVSATAVTATLAAEYVVLSAASALGMVIANTGTGNFKNNLYNMQSSHDKVPKLENRSRVDEDLRVKVDGVSGNGGSKGGSETKEKKGDSKSEGAGSAKTNNGRDVNDVDINNLPEGWTKTENNGFTHVRDGNGRIRIRIDPPDAKTPYPHKHVYAPDGTPLDVNGKPVSPKSPDAHIPLK